MSFYSPIDRLAQNLPRPKGTGSEFMTELSKMPGYKSQEAEDRGLQALMNLPKMERADFIAKLKAYRGPPVEENTFAKSILRNPGLNVVPNEDPHHEHWTLPGGTNYREILLKHGDPKEEFPGEPAHFGGEPNILASIRAKDRVGPNGEKILHLEEIQSDWHQQGREQGYAQPETKRLTGIVKKEPPSHYGFAPDYKVVWEDGTFSGGYGSHEAAESRAAEGKSNAKTGVPDAPFKKNWHELALKKMIHHAAANGYDSIAITPGAEQADRYGLAKHIGMMSYNPEDQHFQAFKPNRETAISERGATPERVSELVGKELAQKLMAAPKQMGHHYIEGDDMKVGGEGMKGFYDKIVPNFLNQFGKKYGAKVALHGYKLVTKEKSGQPTYNFRGEPSGEAVYPEESTQLHHFPITPEMRADVTKNGVPLYADGGPVPPLRPLNPQLAAMREQMAAQSALHKAYDEAMKSVYTNQMPTFAQWVASQGKAKGGKVSRETHDANLAKYLVESQIKHRVYHGTGDTQIRKFKGHRGVAAHFGLDPKIANQFAEERHNDVEDLRRLGDIDPHEEAGAVVYPAYVQVKNIFDVRKPQHRKLIPELRNVDDISFDHLEDAIPEIKKHGFDSYYDFEFGHKTDKNPTGLAVFRPHQIKSAIGNRGTYDPKDPDITKAKGGKVSRETHDANLAKFLAESKVKDRLYHATKNTFDSFKPSYAGTFLTHNPEFANEFAEYHAIDPVGEEGPYGLLGAQGARILPVHVQVKNPFDYQNPKHREILRDAAKKFHGTDKMTKWINGLDRNHNFDIMESNAMLEPLKNAGFDSYYVSENGNKNLAVFDPSKIKSAVGNRGTYDPKDPDITKAKGGSVKPVGYTKEQVTVSPNLDAMRYELESVKHYTKKVK